MLTKILTAAFALIVALIVLRFFAERARRAQLRGQAEARKRTEARDSRTEARPDAKPNMVTTLEVDPDTGVYRPKG
jgi:flagellar biosynthesis/type III secretory pathway M-ring protein FliF/YscJ